LDQAVARAAPARRIASATGGAARHDALLKHSWYCRPDSLNCALARLTKSRPPATRCIGVKRG